MLRKSKTRRMREMKTDARAAARLTRLFLAELARWTYESTRRRRALELGALAVGVTTAGVVAKRTVHRGEAPTPTA